MMVDILIGIWLLSMALIGIRLLVLLKKNNLKFFGKPFLNPVVFYAGKIALVGTWGAAFLELTRITNNPTPEWATPIIIMLVIVSWVLVYPAEYKLGTRLKPGIPEEKTTLETKGIYKYTRHPIYLGAYLFGLASALYAPTTINAAFLLIIIIVHEQIIKKEEKYLAKKFKGKWKEYSEKTPKYI